MLEHPGMEGRAPAMDGDDQDVIADPRYDETEQAIHLGANLVAGPVPASVWAYQQEYIRSCGSIWKPERAGGSMGWSSRISG